MNTDIAKMELGCVATIPPGHEEMLKSIGESLPEINRATMLFGKSQSQFMDSMLTVSHPTPLRNLRQMLAEIEKAREALQDAGYKNRKKEIEIRMLERDMQAEPDGLKREMLGVEKEEKEAGLMLSALYISGAIRKIANYVEQYNTIARSLGISGWDELDFEREEEKYHIMKAFDQGLTAARARGGAIDEGNHIYLTQLGINGAVAQLEVFRYIKKEEEMLREGKEPTHEMVRDFLEAMAKKFADCSAGLARHKGMTGGTITEIATVKR